MLPKILAQILYSFQLDISNVDIQEVPFSRKLFFVLSWNLPPFHYSPSETERKKILISLPHNSHLQIFKDNYRVIFKLCVREDMAFLFFFFWHTGWFQLVNVPLKCGRTGCTTSVGKVGSSYFLCRKYHTSITVLLEADEQHIFEII